MIERYTHKEVAKIWSDKSKLEKWQDVELAVILAREQMGIFPAGTYLDIKTILDQHPIDDEAVAWWKARDKEINHDLNAFIDERLRHLPPELHQFWHKGMTSYDTEEPALALMLRESVLQLELPQRRITGILLSMAEKYRYTPMLGRTHGQEAKLQSFGKRCLTWLKAFTIAFNEMLGAHKLLSQSKLSGAIGNYQGLTLAEEAKALEILGLKPFIGATQIMPRVIYVPLANALELMVASLTQIAEDIRLGARSGNPIMQEPFGKKQKGSSAMPHKKNTITCEQQIGMLTMARNFAQMLRERVVTWEERAIEQSCVERVAWPDLFHVVMQSFKNMIKVLDGLQVFPDNMMLEIQNSRGCYASEDAKDWLKERFADVGLMHEDAYRVVQLASFMAHDVCEQRQLTRLKPLQRLSAIQEYFTATAKILADIVPVNNIREIIREGSLTQVYYLTLDEAGQIVELPQLAITHEQIRRWNEVLKQIFASDECYKSWEEIFDIAYHLRGEAAIFEGFGLNEEKQ